MIDLRRFVEFTEDRLAQLTLILACFVLGCPQPAQAQLPMVAAGEAVPRDVREMYDRGLQYLASSQTDKGDWSGGIEQGPGITGMALLALLASGEDANFGLYSNPIRKALRNIITAQDSKTGFIGMSMYHHGFAMLALAEPTALSMSATCGRMQNRPGRSARR